MSKKIFRMSIRISEEERQAIERYAKEKEESQNRVVNRAIITFLKIPYRSRENILKEAV